MAVIPITEAMAAQFESRRRTRCRTPNCDSPSWSDGFCFRCFEEVHGEPLYLWDHVLSWIGFIAGASILFAIGFMANAMWVRR